VDLMRPWLTSGFDRALPIYEHFALFFPTSYPPFRADMELERANYIASARLLKDANDPKSPGVRMRLARLLYYAGNLRGAVATVQQTGLDSRGRVGLHLSNTLALVHLEQGNFRESADQFQNRLKLPRKTNSQIDEPETILALNGFALANLGLRNPVAAADAAVKALRLSQRSWGKMSIPALDSMLSLAAIRAEQHNLPETRELVYQCLSGRIAIYGHIHPKVAEALEAEARLEVLMGDRDAAVQDAAQAVQIRQTIARGENEGPPPVHPIPGRTCETQGYWPARALLTLGNAYAAAGDLEMAARCFDNAIPVLEAVLGKDAPVAQQARLRRATFQSTPDAVSH